MCYAEIDVFIVTAIRQQLGWIRLDRPRETLLAAGSWSVHLGPEHVSGVELREIPLMIMVFCAKGWLSLPLTVALGVSA